MWFIEVLAFQLDDVFEGQPFFGIDQVFNKKPAEISREMVVPSGAVGGQHHVGHLPQRMIRGQRLRIGHVKAPRPSTSPIAALAQGRKIDDASPPRPRHRKRRPVSIALKIAALKIGASPGRRAGTPRHDRPARPPRPVARWAAHASRGECPGPSSPPQRPSCRRPRNATPIPSPRRPTRRCRPWRPARCCAL